MYWYVCHVITAAQFVLAQTEPPVMSPSIGKCEVRLLKWFGSHGLCVTSAGT
jgi:hypothetical protein